MATAAAVIPAPVPEGTPKRASGTNASIGGAGAISRGKDTGGKGSAASSTGRSVNTSQRKNFKERLHSAIQEGDAAQELPGAHLQDEMSACVSLLMEGCPESFVTFFNIVHEQAGHDSRRPRSSKLSKTLPKAASALPRAKYPLIKQQLTVAETAARAGDYETCYGCYMTLGKLFDQQGNLRRAVFFYHKCLVRYVPAMHRKRSPVFSNNLPPRFHVSAYAIPYHYYVNTAWQAPAMLLPRLPVIDAEYSVLFVLSLADKCMPCCLPTWPFITLCTDPTAACPLTVPQSPRRCPPRT